VRRLVVVRWLASSGFRARRRGEARREVGGGAAGAKSRGRLLASSRFPPPRLARVSGLTDSRGHQPSTHITHTHTHTRTHQASGAFHWTVHVQLYIHLRFYVNVYTIHLDLFITHSFTHSLHLTPPSHLDLRSASRPGFRYGLHLHLHAPSLPVSAPALRITACLPTACLPCWCP
jgi:hypothetical protein